MEANPNPELRQELRSYQIFFIVLSAVIGTGVMGNAAAIEIAGPYGLLVPVCVFGLVALAVGETISELVQLFPCPNAIVEYIYYFVDQELAWVVGFAYWYAYATIFSFQMRSAMNCAIAWGLDTSIAPFIFYLVVPMGLVFLNLLGGVKYFGWIETVGGAVKLVFLIGLTIAIFSVAAADGSFHNIHANFKYNGHYSDGTATATLISFPLIAFGYVGIEGTVMTVFEAKSLEDIRWASRLIHWVTFFLYIFTAAALCYTVKWDDPKLPNQSGGILLRDIASNISRDLRNCTTGSFDKSGEVLIDSLIDTCEAKYNGGIKPLTNAINAFLFYSSLSAGNTSFYIASRTLYGLASKMKGKYAVTRALRVFARIDRRTGVPARAVAITWILAGWITAIRTEHTMPFIGITSSTACLVVWAALCVVSLRYQYWQWICTQGLQVGDDEHQRLYAKFIRGSVENESLVRNIVPWLQPGLAIAGIVGCFAVFVFASGIWWNKPATALEVVASYGVQIFLLAMWAALKIFSGKFSVRWWVRVDDDGSRATDLKGVLDIFMTMAAQFDERAQERGQKRDVPWRNGPEQPGAQPMEPEPEQYEMDDREG